MICLEKKITIPEKHQTKSLGFILNFNSIHAPVFTAQSCLEVTDAFGINVENIWESLNGGVMFFLLTEKTSIS